ncbi:hypothetical protein [Microbacterium suaedae]|uniref:hypothetical protein n=1 Tax=Microbacterium suaedae TaxID=2067813 RepID=UPI000DA11FF4|nr:hypothetical protein [Microbacterium suaedae]
MTDPTLVPTPRRPGGRKLALTSFVLALLGFLLPPIALLAFFPVDDSGWAPLAWMLFAPFAAIAGSIFSVASLIVAIVCLARRARGRGWAISAIVLDAIVLLLSVGAVALFFFVLGQTG